MLYDVKVLYRGEEQTWTYGTNSHAITDCYGIRRNPKTRENVRTPPGGIISLSIFLGFNCNLNCSYCYQKGHHNSHNKVVGSPKMIPEFFEKLKARNLTGIRSITFWGGEPLVFWKTIVEMIPRFEELYPGVRFAAMTNGTLLTEDKVDFMKAHNFQCNVSCDGFPDERGYDLLLLKGPELKYLMEQLGDRTLFQATVGKGREDITPALMRFRKMLGGEVRISFGHPIRAMSKDDPSMNYCMTEWETYANSLYENWLKYPENVIVPKLRDVKTRIIHRIQENLTRGACGPARGDNLVLGLDGNTYSCHAGSGTPSGTLEDYESRSMDEFLLAGFVDEFCKDCPVRFVCRSGCPMTDKDGFAASCMGRYGWSMGVIKMAWKELFDVEVISITPHKKE